MNKNVKRRLIIVIAFILIIFWGNNFGGRNNDQMNVEKNYIGNAKLSVLPDDLKEALRSLEIKAAKKQESKTNEGFNRLNFFSFLEEDNIKSTTPLILQVYYTGSKKTVQKVTNMPTVFAGLTIKELGVLDTDWEIKQYKPEKGLILYKEINDLAPEDKKIMHLGIREGKVAIYYGRSGNEYLKQIIDIMVDDLPYSVKKSLENGIVIYSQEELLSILEGLVSSINKD